MVEIITVVSSSEKKDDVSTGYVVVANPQYRSNNSSGKNDVLYPQVKISESDSLPRLVSGVANEAFLAKPDFKTSS